MSVASAVALFSCSDHRRNMSEMAILPRRVSNNTSYRLKCVYAFFAHLSQIEHLDLQIPALKSDVLHTFYNKDIFA